MTPIPVPPKSDNTTADRRWQARVDLAAAHRLVVWHGFNEAICNHFTLIVPGAADRYLQIPYGLHCSEVTAGSFSKSAMTGAC